MAEHLHKGSRVFLEGRQRTESWDDKQSGGKKYSLFEIDDELEEAFDQLQQEREITGTISNESRERCVQLFAELGKKIDRIAAFL